MAIQRPADMSGDKLRALKTEVERLRAALGRIANHPVSDNYGSLNIRIAREALAKENN